MNSDFAKQLLADNSLQEGQTAYLILSSWLEQFKKRVIDEENPEAKIPPIPNESLLSKGELIPGLIEHVDFEVISETAWNALLEAYGGGPSIPRPIEFDPKANTPVVIISPPKFVVFYRDQRRNFTYSLYVILKIEYGNEH